MYHYQSLRGGTLKDLLVCAGYAVKRVMGDRVFLEHPVYGRKCAVNVLHQYTIEDVTRLCRKRRITTEQFQQLLSQASVPV